MKYLLYLAAAIMLVALGLWLISFPDTSTIMATPALMKKWEDQVYGLDDGEVVRLVPPPFTPGRAQSYTGMLPALVKIRGQLAYEVRLGGVARWGAGARTGTVASAIRWCSRRFVGDVNGCDFDAPPALASLTVDGDWVVDNQQPVERRLAAVESIVSQVTQRRLAIEMRPAEKDVIVARGRWDFHPLEGLDETMRTGIHMYTDALESKTIFAEVRSRPADFLAFIGRFTGRTVIDETGQNWPYQIAWYSHASAQKAARSDSARAILLANLTKQTSLTFVEERRTMPVWFVSERGASTKPGEDK